MDDQINCTTHCRVGGALRHHQIRLKWGTVVKREIQQWDNKRDLHVLLEMRFVPARDLLNRRVNASHVPPTCTPPLEPEDYTLLTFQCIQTKKNWVKFPNGPSSLHEFLFASL